MLPNCLLLFVLLALISNVIAADSEMYLVSDAEGLGRSFDGIGAVSGGGATSKLLPSYPDKQRNEILDLLFKPNYGASLQILKVEIGGDDDTTDGAEASHMREPNEENYQRGYEWWLMKEAKKRNPNIKFQALAWSWPNWLGNKILSNPYGNITNTATYVAKWIQGAKQHHDITIDTVGIWNEKVTNLDYILELRRVLNAFGLTACRIVAPDHLSMSSASFLRFLNNAAVMKAIDAFGAHYPGTILPWNAIRSGKPLWSSEDYSTFNDDIGAGCFARIINRNYAYSYMTSTIAWNLITSYYPGLAYPRNGLMNAYEPWSGHYVISNPIWITAHTTQFTQIGWKYLKHGSGVGPLKHGGTFVSFTDSNQLTIVIETMTRDHSICVRPPLLPYQVKSQEAVFRLAGTFTKYQQLHVWRTTLRFGPNQNSTVFVKDPQPVEVSSGGLVKVPLVVDQIVTLTSMDTGFKGLPANIPAPGDFPLPYKDTFESYREFEEPALLAPQTGAWETVTTSDATHGKVARQMVKFEPVNWCFGNRVYVSPFAIIGSHKWSVIKVSVDVNIPSVDRPDVVMLGARVVKKPGCGSGISTGVFLRIHPESKTINISRDFAGVLVLGSYEMSEALQVDRWYNLRLNVDNNYATAYIDGTEVLKVELPLLIKNQTGHVAIAAREFGRFDIDNLQIS